MKLKIIIALSLFWGLLVSCSDDPAPTGDKGVEIFDPVAVNKSNSTALYMHYMTWFESKESSAGNTWGVHWTMANRNPDVTNGQGQREIASHYYPLIGPYHSGDRDVIEYHLLLMKYAGVDGILIDWYGTYDVNDYAIIKENTDAVIAMLDKLGIKYAMVYEDRTLPEVVNSGLGITNESVAKTDLRYLESNCFNNEAYLHINGSPLLMVFGPITLQTEQAWTNVFNALATKPTFLTLWNESADAGQNAGGEYAWVYQDNSHLDNFYANRMSQLETAMGGAYPGFNDYYQEGGWGSEIGWTIDHNNGATLDETLNMASDAGVDFLQLITWNDFGEGTMIEPTVELGFSYLQHIRSFAGVSQPSTVFEAIHTLYQCRKQYASDKGIQKQLDQAFYYLVSLQVDKAISILNQVIA